jgi:asparagine synthase (glutamine-hydrolysing)
MCGIVGVIAPNAVDPAVLQRMSDALSPRGPDGHGAMWYVSGAGIRIEHEGIGRGGLAGASTAFGHRRLAIIDLSEANSQPMLDEGGQYCLAFNGEIYNYLELRTELEGQGYAFRTNGDTEVLLRAYQAWGPECLTRLNGMWAFALLDVPRRRIVLSRDRFGIKPLYLTIRNGALYFASEIKALLAVPDLPREPNECTVARFLLTGLVDDTVETFFQGVEALPAGHWLSVPLDHPAEAKSPIAYWAFPEATFTGTEHEAAERFRELFLDAVRIHMRSDVPVGTCLSGGLDSSSIVCAADLLRRDGALPTYTHHAFGYRSPDGASNEAPHMERVATATQAAMHYVEFDANRFEDTLPNVLHAQDEPFGSASIVAQWFVFERAKAEGMKVMLDGQGADETLAGYHLYFTTLGIGLVAVGDLLGFRRLRAAYERDIGSFPMTVRLAARLLLARWAPRLDAVLRRRHSLVQLRPVSIALRNALTRPEWLESPAASKAATATSLTARLQLDVRSLMLPALLRYEDRNSMAHSIEARVPFLDHRLVELAFMLPDRWKISGITTKSILRRAMQGILPEGTRNRRDKIGFTPDPKLTISFAQKNRESLLANPTELEQRWFHSRGVETLLTRYDGSVAAEFGLWRVLNTKLWARQFWG